MKTFKEHTNNIIMCLFELIVGILLLVDPLGFTDGIFTVIGAVLIILGLVQVLKYFRTNPQEASQGQILVIGLIFILVGVFCILKKEWLTDTFSVLTIIYGIIILFTGILKVQLTFDMLRLKNNKWFLAALNAIISIACACVVLNNPFDSTDVLWKFVAVALIVESVFDIITILASRIEKKAEPVKQEEKANSKENKED